LAAKKTQIEAADFPLFSITRFVDILKLQLYPFPEEDVRV